MNTQSVGPVDPTATAISSLRPLELNALRVTGGFWAERMRINRERSLMHGYAQLEAAGNLHNFELAAGTTSGSYRSIGVMFSGPFPFLDSDVHKWLEACGWELGREDDDQLREAADHVIGLVARAQRPDGYLNTFVQVLAGGRAYQDLQWGHELYTLGHLLQAAVAWRRALGDDRLIQVALGAVGHVQRELGQSDQVFIEGHAEFEMALVELFRTTGDRSQLDLAARMIDARGHGALGSGRFGPNYWQDQFPVRDAASVVGHAVRQLYLDCGAVDVAVETGDRGLLEAVLGRWRDMVGTRMYLTGGVGSRHVDESFGAPFELPPDRAYTESCAGIASVMLAWRLLLATGEQQCADLIERTLYNAVLPGIARDGTDFFYVNPLQHRTPSSSADDHGRKPWYACACCPPNLMRLMSSWPNYAATADDGGVHLQQFATGELTTELPLGTLRVAIETDYPWSGTVSVRVIEAPQQELTLSLRVPAWCHTAHASVGGEDRGAAAAGLISERRTWRPGDSFVLDLEMPARVTWPDPRIDAIRGCAAVERGPLVYCLETADLPVGAAVEEVEFDVDVPLLTVDRVDVATPSIGIQAGGRVSDHPADTSWPYATARPDSPADKPVDLQLIPYFAWANRGQGGMRTWIPVARTGRGSR